MTEKSRVSDSNAGEVRGRVGVDEALVDGLGAEGVDPLGVLLEVVQLIVVLDCPEWPAQGIGGALWEL